VQKAIKDAKLVIVDAPRADDQSAIERIAGKYLRESTAPIVEIQTIGGRMRPVRMEPAKAQRLFDYYLSGRRANHERMFVYIKALLAGTDLALVPPPVELPNRGMARYAGRLLNIRPSLLPAFAGLHTQQRALDAGCKFAGATVH
jgi:cobaltochelatase CobN